MGGSTPKGEARGECANVLPERDQDANETLACQSTAYRGNETNDKTVFEARISKKTRRSGSSGGAHRTIKTGSDFSTGPTRFGEWSWDRQTFSRPCYRTPVPTVEGAGGRSARSTGCCGSAVGSSFWSTAWASSPGSSGGSGGSTRSSGSRAMVVVAIVTCRRPSAASPSPTSGSIDSSGRGCPGRTGRCILGLRTSDREVSGVAHDPNEAPARDEEEKSA